MDLAEAHHVTYDQLVASNFTKPAGLLAETRQPGAGRPHKSPLVREHLYGYWQDLVMHRVPPTVHLLLAKANQLQMELYGGSASSGAND